MCILRAAQAYRYSSTLKSQYLSPFIGTTQSGTGNVLVEVYCIARFRNIEIKSMKYKCAHTYSAV